MSYKTIQQFIASVKDELENKLVPFWLQRSVDTEHGGFIGRMSNEHHIETKAPKGLILNTRLLWTFSALYRFNGDQRCRDMAYRAHDYLDTFFKDRLHGGAFWQVDFQGQLLDGKKKIYGQAFYIYALSEYYLAFSDRSALEDATKIFDLIESFSHDDLHGGYIEVCNRDWTEAQDFRLSDKDMDEKKSMNSHLHLLEAYTNLYRIWPNAKLKSRLEELLYLFEKYIIDSKTRHMKHFFDEAWKARSQSYTFGHDIEASWLFCETASVLGDLRLISLTERLALNLAKVTLKEGFDIDGGLFYEGENQSIIDSNKEWWPQAESTVGLINAYEICHEPVFLEAARKTWQFITKYIVDRKHGDWFWRVDQAGRPDLKEPKVSEWKGPYHSVRACLETIRRLKAISESSHNECRDL